MISSLIITGCDTVFPFSETSALFSRYDQSETETVDVVCLLGDSNAAGADYAADWVSSEMALKAGNSYRFNSTGSGVAPHTWEALVPGTNSGSLSSSTNGVFGLETPLAAYYYEQFGKPLYFIKTGFGGYAINVASPQSFNPDADPTAYLNLPNPILEALGQSAGLPSPITSYRLHLVWMLGANDAADATWATEYEESMDAVFAQLESDLGESFIRVVDVALSPEFGVVDVTSVNIGKESFISGLGIRAELVERNNAQIHPGESHWTGAGIMHLAEPVFNALFFQ